MKVDLFCDAAYLTIKKGDAYKFPIFTVSQFRDAGELISMLKHFKSVNEIGTARLETLAGHPTLYTVAEIDSYEQTPQLAQRAMESFTQIISSLWFVKNNSCNIPSITGVADNGRTFFSNSNAFFSNAEGLYENTSFNLEDWKSAIYYLDLSIDDADREPNPILKSDFDNAHITTNSYHFGNFNSISRIKRALTFLSVARQNALLPAKISYYVVVLECLFSGDDTGEITHKIAQRIANYIGTSATEKSDIFKFIKDTYKVRSKYLHGQQLSNKHDKRDKLLPMSIRLDNLLREILTKLLPAKEPFLQDSDKLKEWLDDEMF